MTVQASDFKILPDSKPCSPKWKMEILIFSNCQMLSNLNMLQSMNLILGPDHLIVSLSFTVYRLYMLHMIYICFLISPGKFYMYL